MLVARATPFPNTISINRLVILGVTITASSCRAPTSATAAAVATTTATSTAVVLARRWAHKGEVHLDGLLEQLGVVGAIDGSARLLER